MASACFEPEPDLAPLYPTAATVLPLLSPNFGLEPTQKTQLVTHCLIRACVFGELSLLTYLLRDPQAQPHVDLCIRDEEDIGLISTTILGFGSESDRDIEREECVRLLLSEGADVVAPDKGALWFHFISAVPLIHLGWHRSISWMDALALRRCALPSDPCFPFPQIGLLAVRTDTPKSDRVGSRHRSLAHPRAGNNSPFTGRSYADRRVGGWKDGGTAEGA